MFWDFGGFGYGGFGDDGVDRSGWKDKSDAAIRREDQAKHLFDAFLEKSKASQVFPVTEEVVPPAVHLTDACWKTFKKYVVAKGCTTKRREATFDERKKSGDSRKGKLYVISVTVPVHPDQAKEAMAEKKRKAAEVAEEKRQKAAAAAEKKRIEAELRAEEERQLQAKIKEEYASIESSFFEKKVLTEQDSNITNEPAKKKLKLSVPLNRILQHADSIHQDRARAISNEVSKELNEERTRLLSELSTKFRAIETNRKQEAQDRCNSIKKCIEDMAVAAKE